MDENELKKCKFDTKFIYFCARKFCFRFFFQFWIFIEISSSKKLEDDILKENSKLKKGTKIKFVSANINKFRFKFSFVLTNFPFFCDQVFSIINHFMSGIDRVLPLRLKVLLFKKFTLLNEQFWPRSKLNNILTTVKIQY